MTKPGQHAVSEVLEFFLSRFRFLCHDLIEGTREYETQSTTIGHIQDDYHGRFLLELIQNADDAGAPGGSIALVLDRQQDPPVLFAANMGTPFRREDVDDIRNLGLSRKDVNRCIGNKGLGFRSVLEVTTNPRIYSLADTGAGEPGYCFEFTPRTRDALRGALSAIRDGKEVTDALSKALQFALSDPVFTDLDPAPSRLRQRLQEEESLIDDVCRRIEPNVYPLPIFFSQDPYQSKVKDLWERGFVTVVALPLNRSSASSKFAEEALEKLDACTLLFLRRATRMSIDFLTETGEHSIHYTAETREENGLCRTIIKSISGSATPDRLFYRTSKTLKGEKLARTQAELAAQRSSWKTVEEACVTVAMECAPSSSVPTGYVSIGLPTEIPSGSGLWIDGPFHASLNRKQVDLSPTSAYNHFLICEAMSLLPKFVESISSDTHDDAPLAALRALDYVGEESDITEALPLDLLEQTPFIHRHISGQGTASNAVPPEEIQVLPRTDSGVNVNTVLTTEVLSPYLCLPSAVYNQDEVWAGALRRVLGVMGFGTPGWQTIAAAVNSVSLSLAEQVSAGDAEPSVFLTLIEELQEWFGFNERQHLNGCHILLDSNLVARPVGSRHPVIFEPLQRVEDEAARADLTENWPSALDDFIAFMHPEAIGPRPPPGESVPKVTRFLREGRPRMVQEFATEPLVNRALVPAMEATKTHEGTLVRLLLWAFNLWLAPEEKATGARINWSRVLVPTTAGWVSADEAYLSHGWSIDDGEMLESALSRETASGQLRPFLLPYSQVSVLMSSACTHATYPTQAKLAEFLCDVLRVNCKPKVIQFTDFSPFGRDNVCKAKDYSVDADELTNTLGLSDPVWEDFVNGVERDGRLLAIIAKRECSIDAYHTIDGLDQLSPVRAAPFFRLVCRHFEEYGAYLSVLLRRTDTGQQVSVPSTLSALLRCAAWIPVVSPSGEFQLSVPGKGILVEAQDLPGRQRPPNSYSLLPHLPAECASEPGAEAVFSSIGATILDHLSAVDGCRWLGWLADQFDSFSNRSLARGLWQELLRRTAEAYDGSEDVLEGITENHSGWSSVLVDRPVAGTRLEDIFVDETTFCESDPLYIADTPSRLAALRQHLDMVVYSGGAESTVRLLHKRFGNGAIIPTSLLQLVPRVNGELFEAHEQQSARLLEEVAPWLIEASLAVLAYGRTSRMNIDGREFGQYQEMLTAMQVCFCDSLDVTVEGAPGIVLSEQYFTDSDKRMLAVCRECQDDLRTVLKSIGAYLDVQDFAASAFCILDPLRSAGGDLGLRAHPPEGQLAGLLESEVIGEHEYQRFCQRLDQNSEWYLRRVLPCLLSIAPTGNTGTTDNALKAYQDGFRYAQRHASLQGVWLRLYGEEMPSAVKGLLRELDEATDLHSAAFTAWKRADVPLKRWNAHLQEVSPGYPAVKNLAAWELSGKTQSDLVPAALALLRDHLDASGRKQEYRAHRRSIEEFADCSREAEDMWDPPIGVLVGPLLDMLASLDAETIEPVPDWVLRLAPQDGESSVADVLTRLASEGVDLREDDGAVADSNRQQLLCSVIQDIRILGVAIWLDRGIGTELPAALKEEKALTTGLNQGIKDGLLSLLEFAPLSQTECLEWCHSWWDAHGLNHQLGSLPDRHNVVDMAGALEISQQDFERAQKRRKEEQQGLHRPRRILTIFSQHYEIPEQDTYAGLGPIAAANFDISSQPHFDPSIPKTYAQLRARGNSPPGPREPRMRGHRITKTDQVAGALAEYLVWLKIQGLSGGRIRREAWCSEMRTHFLDDGEPGNDLLGYDFKFQLNGNHYEVEVKATKSRKTNQVRLGPTEVTWARHRAEKKRGPIWQIWLITDVFKNPEFHVLSNPYSESCRSIIETRELGALLRFAVE